ncbi:MAG: UbiA family prenyltransferase [Candidatus Aenigmarchaeota archaeon]|nr:UbiA family prenyltransferase [Candidatus Aenigmarchaeota archaeon]
MEKTLLSVAKEALSFIKPEICFFCAGIAASGYIVFNGIDAKLLQLFIAAFLGTGASYAYNYMKDAKEDMANGKKLNFFVINSGRGRIFVSLLYVVGFLFSLLSPVSAAFYVVMAVMSVFYSRNRIKEIFLVKNVFTGMTISLSFLLGAAAGGFSPAMVPCVAAIFFLGSAANALGDIRGRKGDEAIGMITLPIAIGVERTKLVIYSLLSLCGASILLSGSRALYPVIPFVVLTIMCLSRNNIALSRVSMLSSFALLPLFIIAGIW